MGPISRVRLSSKNPDVPPTAMIASQNFTASLPVEAGLMTGPKSVIWAQTLIIGLITPYFRLISDCLDISEPFHGKLCMNPSH